MAMSHGGRFLGARWMRPTSYPESYRLTPYRPSPDGDNPLPNFTPDSYPEPWDSHDPTEQFVQVVGESSCELEIFDSETGRLEKDGAVRRLVSAAARGLRHSELQIEYGSERLEAIREDPAALAEELLALVERSKIGEFLGQRTDRLTVRDAAAILDRPPLRVLEAGEALQASLLLGFDELTFTGYSYRGTYSHQDNGWVKEDEADQMKYRRELLENPYHFRVY